MKNTLKVVLAIALFCSATFAGDMGAGGLTGDMGTGGKTIKTVPTKTTRTTEDGDMGAGGRSCIPGQPCTGGREVTDETSIYDIVAAFLTSIF